MQQFLTILAKVWSIVCYPLWMPTIAMALYSRNAIGIGTTFFMTAMVPLMVILLGIRRGHIADIYIDNPSERTLPYLYTMLCYGVWCYFLWKVMHVAPFFLASAIGGLVCLGLVTVVNLRWKISSHLAGIGGLIGGILAFFYYAGIMPSFSVLICLFLPVLLIMYARLYLRAHDEWQVIIGFIVGLCSTFLPSLLVC